MDHTGETTTPRPARKFPNSLLEPRHRFRRQAPLRLLVVCEAESQELPLPWASHGTLLAVDPKLELRREQSRYASQHSFAGPPTADVNVVTKRLHGCIEAGIGRPMALAYSMAYRGLSGNSSLSSRKSFCASLFCFSRRAASASIILANGFK